MERVARVWTSPGINHGRDWRTSSAMAIRSPLPVDSSRDVFGQASADFEQAGDSGDNDSLDSDRRTSRMAGKRPVQAGRNRAGRGNPRIHRANNSINPFINIYYCIGLDLPRCPVLSSIPCTARLPARRPVWLMRQAGRYLPEYRELRAEKGGFLELVYDSEAAAEITLAADPPLRFRRGDPVFRYPDRAARDGAGSGFLAGEGPQLVAAAGRCGAGCASKPVPERFDPIYERCALVRDALGPETTLLGFAGTPWTVATYMVAGEGSRRPARDARSWPIAIRRAFRRSSMRSST